MPKPTAGRQYTIVDGDTLSHIARAAYGDGARWREIWQANQTRLRSGDPNLIFPGEIIIIPKLVDLEPEQTIDIPGKDSDDFTLVIDGVEIPVQAGKILRTVDTAADAWTATIAYNTENVDLYELLSPYKYNDAKVYLGGRLMVSGRCYSIGIKIGKDGISKTLKGESYTVDLVDSTIKPPFERKKVTLKQVIDDLVKPFQIKVVYDFEPGGSFDRVTAEPTESIFSHISKLAKQRSALLSSTNKGELLVTQADTSKNVGSLIEGKPPFEQLNIEFDGRRRFNVYKVLNKRRGKSTISAVSKDDVVPLSRFKTINADDTTAGNIQKTADWERSKQVAESLDFTIPVSTWYAPNRELWQENTIVTVQSKALYIPTGYDFLVKQVEFSYEANKIGSKLSLVPPQVYTEDQVEEPWIL